MSKLDNIILECVNKALDQKEEKLGDYVDPTKEQIKALMLELIGGERAWDTSEPYDNPDIAQGYNEAITELQEKVNQL